MLRRNYSLMIPPVLLMEILADLRKADDIETGRTEVQRLANESVPACSYVNVGFRQIVIGESLKQKMSPEGEQKMMNHIRKVMEGVALADPSDMSIDECDFVVHKRHVRPDGPCICGSDRMFKDCCGREIVAELQRQRG